MKKIFTKFKKMSLGIFASVLFVGSLNATTYTATQSGSWSSALTWGGVGSPGGTVGTIDNVVIPAGITVTLDMDVTVSSLVSYINVTGSLTSTTNSLTITQGALQGTGTMNLFYVEIGSLGSMTFSGTMTAKNFVNSGAAITVSGGVIINDSLILNSGSIAFNTGSTLTMNTNSNIKIAAGSMSVSGGTLSATNMYDVIYVGSSKTSGVETSISSGLHNVWINMTDSSQIVTMGRDITVNGTMHNTMGKIAIAANTLKLMSDYISTANGKIQGSATSRLIIGLSTTTASSLVLSAGTQFQYLEVNLATSPTANFSGSFTVDTMYVKNGSTGFANTSSLTMSSNGVFIWEGGSFALNTGSFVGTNSYSVIYKGTNKTSAFEATGLGLQNVMVDMTSASNVVSINSNLTVAGLLTLNKGSLNLNAYKLHLTGAFSSTSSGTFQGNASSSLFINNTAAAFGDTLNFASSQAMLDSLSINAMPSSWVWLGSGLTVENLSMMSGGIALTNGDLTINSTGSIMGYDSTKYINTTGSGSLIMNVNISSPYVVFPVGTNSNYSPASLQIISGTAGMFHVNVANGMWSNGTNGSNLALTQSVVNRTWFIQEPTQTGTLNANLQVKWKSSEEMNNFDRTHAYISHYNNAAWDMSSIGAAISASGSYYQMTRSNVSSFSPFAVVDQNAVTGIEKTIANNVNLSMYPNPVANFITIDFKNTDAKFVEVYNEIGSKVYSAEIINKDTLHKADISSLPAGVYYVKIITGTNPIVKKMIKS
jgi:hypothetical protein